MKNDRLEAIQTARQWLETHPVYLDTETTGLSQLAEVCDIAAVDHTGEALLDTLIKPLEPIPQDAVRIHGIANTDVADAPAFKEILFKLWDILSERTAIIYNAEYDLRVMRQSAAAHGVKLDTSGDFRCAINLYAAYWGDWNDYHGGYTWQSLSNAARQCGIQIPPDLHRARADAELTRRVLQFIAESEARND